MDCDFVARADSEEELLKKAAEHAATTHDMKEIPEAVLTKVRAAIRMSKDGENTLEMATDSELFHRLYLVICLTK